MGVVRLVLAWVGIKGLRDSGVRFGCDEGFKWEGDMFRYLDCSIGL